MDVLASLTQLTRTARTAARAFDPTAVSAEEAGKIAKAAARAKNILAGLEAAAAKAYADSDRWRREGSPPPKRGWPPRPAPHPARLRNGWKQPRR